MVKTIDKAIVTVVTQDYSHYAVVLGQSILKHEADTEFYIVFLDEIPDEIRQGPFGAHCLLAEELGIPNWKRFSFQYTPFELPCAVKPFAMDWALRQGMQRVVYLDSDMELLGPLNAVWEKLEKHPLVLTPHLPLVSKSGTAGISNCLLYLRAGSFNAGFVGVNASVDGVGFTSWWASVLFKHCIVDIADGLFVDQKWLDFVPGLFPGAYVLQNPGYNFGHWFLPHCNITDNSTSPLSDANIEVDGHPLVLMHYSQMTPDGFKLDDTKQSTNHPTSCHRLRQLVCNYYQKLEDAGRKCFEDKRSGLHSLVSGEPIHRSWREAIRRDEPDWLEIEDPFRLAETANWRRSARSFERKSRRWRKDWRHSWAKTHGVRGVVNRMINRVKSKLRHKS